MSKKIILIAFSAILSLGLFSQPTTMELTFTAVNNATYMQLDSIKIMNQTQGGDTTLNYPDTVLSIYYIGIAEIPKNLDMFQVFQNYPNPAAEQTTVSLYVPEKDKVRIIVTDILGQIIIQSERVMDRGKHSYSLTPGSSHLYFFSAQWRGNSSSIKILQTRLNSAPTSSLEYLYSEDYTSQLKTIHSVQGFAFTPGDDLLYVGYANRLEIEMLDSPIKSTTYTFHFPINNPCPETPTVYYEGQIYNTIQIFSQCWLKENLNVGVMLTGSQSQLNNGIIEKYCYNHEPDSCTKYGGLYQWDEMMRYTTQEGSRGICPLGWHLPTDYEWKVLEEAVASPVWNGNDAGTNLKSTSGWIRNGNGTDLFGFSGLPGGQCHYSPSFEYVGEYGRFWTSTDYEYQGAWCYWITWYHPGVVRGTKYTHEAFSVRCLRDY